MLQHHKINYVVSKNGRLGIKLADVFENFVTTSLKQYQSFVQVPFAGFYMQRRFEMS